MRFYITLIATFCLVFAQANAQKSNNDPTEVATRSLETLRQLVTEENYKAMGFESLDELSDIALGDSLCVFWVRLDSLQQYQPGSDPNRLLIDGNKIIYSVTVKEQVRSSIIVEMMNENWSTTDFGGPNFVKMLTNVRRDYCDSTGFVVQVLAFNLNFIAHRTDNELMFTPILDDPIFGFKTGGTLLATEVFDRILPAAKEHDGLPR